MVQKSGQRTQGMYHNTWYLNSGIFFPTNLTWYFWSINNMRGGWKMNSRFLFSSGESWDFSLSVPATCCFLLFGVGVGGIELGHIHESANFLGNNPPSKWQLETKKRKEHEEVSPTFPPFSLKYLSQDILVKHQTWQRFTLLHKNHYDTRTLTYIYIHTNRTYNNPNKYQKCQEEHLIPRLNLLSSWVDAQKGTHSTEVNHLN